MPGLDLYYVNTDEGNASGRGRRVEYLFVCKLEVTIEGAYPPVGLKVHSFLEDTPVQHVIKKSLEHYVPEEGRKVILWSILVDPQEFFEDLQGAVLKAAPMAATSRTRQCPVLRLPTCCPPRLP